MKLVKKHVPLTRVKIFGAKILYFFVSIFVNTKEKKRIVRDGIHFEVDLTEGIDLSLYLFGSFQSHVYKNPYIQFKPDDFILDIGANIGIMSLEFAKRVPMGKVYAFEPTHYALKKLYRNLELIPELKDRVIVTNCFLSAESQEKPEIVAYSSWSLTASTEADHKVHLGTPMSAEGTPAYTLDDFVSAAGIQKINFIKIDTDGHEYEIFKGGQKSISAFRPKIIFELGLYVMVEKNIDFNFYWNYFHSLNYKLYNSDNLSEITPENFEGQLPRYGSIDVLAIPE